MFSPIPSIHQRGSRLRLILATGSGALGVFAFSPFDLFWLAPLVILALFLLLARAEDGRQGFRTGFSFGLGFFLAGASWVYVSLSVFGGMPFWLAAPATLLFCAVLALFPGGVGWGYARWRPAGWLGRVLFFAALMGLADWLRGWVFTGFPWLAWGYSQTPPSPLAGFVPLVGVYGLGFLVTLAGALLSRWRVGVPVLAVVAGCGFGLAQVRWTEPVGEPVSVALVQGNVPQDLKFRPEQFIRTLSLYRDLVATHPARLTVLPETAVPAFYDQLPPEFVDEMRRLALRQGGDLLIGAATGEGSDYWNSAVSLGVAPEQRYRKTHLVPFGEFVPPGFAWFVAMAHIPLADFARGPVEQATLHLGGLPLAVNICYEDAFGEEIIRRLPEPGVLVNLSNTAWFGDSLAQPQHLQISRMRALETGRPMLRATNTGMTALVGPDGRVEAALPPFTRDVLTVSVRAWQGATPYARWGNWLAVGLMLVATAVGLTMGRKTK